MYLVKFHVLTLAETWKSCCYVALQESDKSSRLTGRTLCVSKKLLYTICDVGHPHEMMAVIILSMLMHRLEKSTMDCIVPMQAIAVFPLVL